MRLLTDADLKEWEAHASVGFPTGVNLAVLRLIADLRAANAEIEAARVMIGRYSAWEHRRIDAENRIAAALALIDGCAGTPSVHVVTKIRAVLDSTPPPVVQ